MLANVAYGPEHLIVEPQNVEFISGKKEKINDVMVSPLDPNVTILSSETVTYDFIKAVAVNSGPSYIFKCKLSCI